MSLKVAILMGSKSDLPVMKEAEQALQELGISSMVAVMSAHRTPEEVAQFARSARDEGYKVIIAGAGGAAHLPGVIAAFSDLPVIGVPIAATPLNGQDALYAIVQMPKGIPVATVAIGGAWNAGILAGEILAACDTPEGQEVHKALQKYRKTMREKALAK